MWPNAMRYWRYCSGQEHYGGIPQDLGEFVGDIITGVIAVQAMVLDAVDNIVKIFIRIGEKLFELARSRHRLVPGRRRSRHGLLRLSRCEGASKRETRWSHVIVVDGSGKNSFPSGVVLGNWIPFDMHRGRASGTFLLA